MKYYTRQIAPEYQESPLYMEDWPENVYVFGNRYYTEHAEELQDIRAALYNIAEEWEAMQDGRPYTKNLHAAIWYELPRDSGKGYTRAERLEIVQLAEECADCFSWSDEEIKIMLRALEIAHGEEYDSATIRGCCQGDWQKIIYPARHGRGWLEAFEAEYFNTGTEWEIHDGEEAPEDPEDISGYSVYCVSWNEAGQRQEIADVIGCDPSDVIMYEFTGYARTACYKEISA